ncbi:MAG TPA: segregation/condensation protein A [Luteitalea sp.]|nr:segregation/condensation protein A [Luteitalea sp.]
MANPKTQPGSASPPTGGQAVGTPAPGADVPNEFRTAPVSTGVDGFESGLERFPVKLEVFEGPLDLLLHLIKKHELDIYDIPIALITKQYLEYIAIMDELQLDVAGDFLVMAATLIHIKSRSLLPRPAPEQEDPEEDPREALVRRLIEHQKFKAAAELLHDRETVRSAQWGRPDERIASLAGEGLDKEPELEVDLFSLMTAFKAVVERAKQRPAMYLPMEQMSIEQRIEQLSVRLTGVEAMGFEDLFDDVAQRADLIVTFLAILEMIRLKVLRVFQTGAGGPIRVYKRDRPAEAPRPIEYHEPSHHARPQGTPGSQS